MRLLEFGTVQEELNDMDEMVVLDGNIKS